MLKVDVITHDQIDSSYDLVLTSRGFRVLALEPEQWQHVMRKLAQLANRRTYLHSGLTVALAMKQPSAEMLPLAILECADSVRYWDIIQQKMVFLKNRDGSPG